MATHIVLVLGRNGADELLGPQVQLARLGVLDRMTAEASLGLRRELRRLFGANQALLDSFLDAGNARHLCQRK
jgi:hypothetical protein